MTTTAEILDAPLTSAQLAQRWQALFVDPTFEDVVGKIELRSRAQITLSSDSGCDLMSG